MRNLIFGLVAGLIAWWLWRKKAEPCHCDDAVAPVVPVVPTAPTVHAYVAPTQAPAIPLFSPPIYTPPPPPPPGPTPAQQCIAAGGGWGWDPNTGPTCYYPAGITVPPPPPAWTPPPQPTCEDLGGTVLTDGSCCREDLGCDPGRIYGCHTDEIESYDTFGRRVCSPPIQVPTTSVIANGEDCFFRGGSYNSGTGVCEFTQDPIAICKRRGLIWTDGRCQ